MVQLIYMPSKFLLKKILISSFFISVFIVPASAFAFNPLSSISSWYDSYKNYLTESMDSVSNAVVDYFGERIYNYMFSSEITSIPSPVIRNTVAAVAGANMQVSDDSPAVAVNTASPQVLYIQGPVGPQGPQGPQGIPGRSGSGGGGSNIDLSSFVTLSLFDSQVDALLTSVESGVNNISNSFGDKVSTALLIVSGNGSIGGDLTVTGTITGNVAGVINPSFTSGSVPFQGASGLDEDNASFNFNNTTNTLTVANLTATAYTNNLSAFSATTSAQLAGVISNETGSGALVFGTSPVFTTPDLGVATATSLAIGGGFGSTGVTISDAGAISADGTVTINAPLATDPAIIFKNAGIETARLRTGNDNIILGKNIATNQYISDSIALGEYALYYSEGSTNVAIGISAGMNTHGVENVYIGYSAGNGISSTGNFDNNNVAIGMLTGYRINDGYDNVFIGHEAGYGSAAGISGYNNIGFGYQPLQRITTGHDNVAVGTQAGFITTTGSTNILIGTYVDATSATASNELNIGGTIYGNLSTDSIRIGAATPTARLHLPAGTITASTAPLKFTSGPLLTTAEAGAVEFLTDAFYGTITTGAARKTFAFLESPSFTTQITTPLAVIDAASPKITFKNGVTEYFSLWSPGNDSIFLGNNAGDATSGNYNIAIGTDSGEGFTSAANYNVFLGHDAGSGYGSSTSGDANVAVGNIALEKITTGGWNTALGYGAGQFVTTGSGNTFIGEEAANYGVTITGDYNTAVGSTALYEIDSGGRNVGIGSYAGKDISSGLRNIAIGYNSGIGLTTGSDNIMIGYNTPPPSATGSSQLNIGNTIYGDLTTDKIGIGTTAPTYMLSLVGTAAQTIWMERNTTAATAGQGLTLSSGGAIAGTADLAGGDLTLKSGISTGSGSSAMHFYTTTAGVSATTDRTPTEKMTILGSGFVGVGNVSPGTLLTVGTDTTNTGNITVYGTGTTCVIGDGVGATNCTSDIRLKDNIETLESELTNIMALRPVTFSWKDKNKDQTTNTGFIAQEVQSIYPNIVRTVYDDYLGIDYAALVVPTIKAVQEINLNLEGIAGTITPLEGSNNESFVAAFFDNLFSKIKDWLGGEGNGVENLCINNTCVTEAQLQELLENADIDSPAPEVESTPETTPPPEAPLLDEGGEDSSPPLEGGVPEGGGGSSEPIPEVNPNIEPGSTPEEVVPGPEVISEPTPEPETAPETSE